MSPRIEITETAAEHLASPLIRVPPSLRSAMAAFAVWEFFKILTHGFASMKFVVIFETRFTKMEVQVVVDDVQLVSFSQAGHNARFILDQRNHRFLTSREFF